MIFKWEILLLLLFFVFLANFPHFFLSELSIFIDRFSKKQLFQYRYHHSSIAEMLYSLHSTSHSHYVIWVLMLAKSFSLSFIIIIFILRRESARKKNTRHRRALFEIATATIASDIGTANGYNNNKCFRFTWEK